MTDGGSVPPFPPQPAQCYASYDLSLTIRRDSGQNMRYWWVNQNQTFRHEIGGGYLWSPKRNANGARNPFYESMREVSPGDLIFSFVDTRIVAIGIAKSYCWECPKPAEFGSAGEYWENVGWRGWQGRPSPCRGRAHCRSRPHPRPARGRRPVRRNVTPATRQ